MDNTCSNNKGLTVGARAKNHLKAHRISNKTLVVIDETLIQELAIDDENTWFEQLRTEDGILLKIQRTRGD
jgi:hypothetical protein